jgi:hypothetical protein
VQRQGRTRVIDLLHRLTQASRHRCCRELDPGHARRLEHPLILATEPVELPFDHLAQAVRHPVV